MIESNIISNTRFWPKVYSMAIQCLLAGLFVWAILMANTAGAVEHPPPADVDITPPLITDISPYPGSYTSTVNIVITIMNIEADSGIDLANSTVVVTSGGVVVSGTLSLQISDGNPDVVFLPTQPLAEGSYQISAQLQDMAGLASTTETSFFVVDRTPPVAPTINPVTTPTATSTQLLSGGKEADTALLSNGLQIIPLNNQTTWSKNITLVNGENILQFSARDRARNISPTTEVRIFLDNIAPGPVTVSGNGNGIGTSINLVWSGAGSDVDHYNVYLRSTPYTDVTGISPLVTIVEGTRAYTVTGLVRATTYYISIIAVDTLGNSLSAVSPIAVKTVDTIAPASPTNLRSTESTLTSFSIAWDAAVDTDNDLAGYKLYVNRALFVGAIDKTVNSYNFNGLEPGNSFEIRLTSVDSSGNESTYVQIDTSTLLLQPTGISSQARDGRVNLSWNASAPDYLVQSYAIYVATAPFTSVLGMTPRVTVNGNITTAGVAGLTNDTAYHFAVTVINTSSGENKNVTTVSATPFNDTAGPLLSNVTYNGASLNTGGTISGSGTLGISASDQSSVSRVEFLLDGSILSTDGNGTNGYATALDILATTDGPHSLSFIAYDSFDNRSQLDLNIIIALAPPDAPNISAPRNGLATNQNTVTVTGSAPTNSQVYLYNGAVQAVGPISISSSGVFSGIVNLNEGANIITAVASNRGGLGPKSTAVTVTLDSSIPDAPTGLFAQARPSGVVRLVWSTPGGSNVVGYDVYRSTTAFTDVTAASKVNTSRITSTSYDDLTSVDNTYFYRVVSMNAVGTNSAASNQTSATSDSVAPKAVAITYNSTGNVDPASGRMAPGIVSVKVTVSETLLTTPFLSISPQAGLPLTIPLTAVTDTEYRGQFTITATTPTGTAYAVFSARDPVGNRGTKVVAGETLEIDTDGPMVSQLTLTPGSPIKNLDTAPVTVTLDMSLSEAVNSGDVASLSYRLSAAGRSDTPITSLTQSSTNPLNWSGAFTLPADAGLPDVESLSFVFSAQDDLGNIGTAVPKNITQVYQGELPPFAAPAGLTATALPGGKVKLTWESVEFAADYQLYRQGPADIALVELVRTNLALTYIDTPGIDGLYKYTVASVRKDNNQEGISSPSSSVEVTVDSLVPNAPQNLTLELTPAGIKVVWQAPVGSEAVTYNLYRSSALNIISIDGLTPTMTGIKTLTSLDSKPSQSDHAYVVTAVDAAGNVSAPSNSVYLNFDLLPVATLEVSQTDVAKPVISWTHTGSTVVGYDLYLGPTGQRTKLNTAHITANQFTDVGFDNTDRIYTVIAVDGNGVESLPRTIILPSLSATPADALPLKRGVMNSKNFTLSNTGSAAVTSLTLKVVAGGKNHLADDLTIAAGETQTVPVVIGGYDGLTDSTPLVTTLEITPNLGERVRIVRNIKTNVVEGGLVLTLATEAFTRGVTGKVRFTLENASDVVIELLTARNNGNKTSPDIRYKLIDADGNVLATQSILQALGANVITLADGRTVARIPAAASFTSDAVDLLIPSAAPNEVTVKLEIDKVYYHLGKIDAVTLQGRSTTQLVPLIDTAYSGSLDSITPATSFGGEDIVITGKAIGRSSGQPLPTVPLKLILTLNGFERSFNILADSSGAFSHRFTPPQGESGIYSVAVVHPDLVERPVHGQFVIQRTGVSPATVNLNVPRNYEQIIPITVTTGAGTILNNVRLEYNDLDQPSGSKDLGVHVTLNNVVTQIGAKGRAKLTATVWGDNTAADTGQIVFKVLSNERALGTVRINAIFSEAKPALYFNPSFIETGVVRGRSVTESLTLENRGLGSLDNIRLTLLSADGTQPAPSWMQLVSAANLGSLIVGAKQSVSLSASPPVTVSEGIYTFKLRITSSNHPTRDITLIVSVVQDGIGHVLFHTADMYTFTSDANGNLIPGLAGVRVRVQNEAVISIDQTLTTDANGEALFSNLPAGRYRFRASAPDHEDVSGRFQIKPGLTAAEDIFLKNNVVTVEWSVTEIALQDKYEITLKATYLTDVPIAVVAVEPAGVNLPDMVPGDAFLGEFTITNYGLIRADNVRVNFPQNDKFFKYEFLGQVPTTLEAKQVVTIPYRIISLASLDPGGAANVTGGGCGTYQKILTATYDYTCAWGFVGDNSTSMSWAKVYGNSCGGGGGGGGSSGGGGSGGTLPLGLGAGGYILPAGGGPSFSPLPGAKCLPGAQCSCERCNVPGGTSAGGSSDNNQPLN